MGKELQISKSQLEIILEKFFEYLKENKEFDAKTVRRLEALAKNDYLNNPKNIESAIKHHMGGKNKDEDN